MEYPVIFLDKIESSRILLNEMIERAIKQGMLNFAMFYTLRDGLNELKLIVVNGHVIDSSFLNKWGKVMGWVSKVFEDTPLLDLLREIDIYIVDIKG